MKNKAFKSNTMFFALGKNTHMSLMVCGGGFEMMLLNVFQVAW